jgi:hypothetical protein
LLESLIDYQNKKIKASNNQLNWDYKNGICTVDAPSAQGVCGFTSKQKTFSLTGVTIESTNDYAVVNVVAMDEKSITESSKILVQVGTVYQPTNWSETSANFTLNNTTVAGFKIDNTGKMPWKCANTQVTLRFKNKGINQATLLDAAGYAKSVIQVEKVGDEVQIVLPANAMYVVLQGTTQTGEIKKNDSGMNVFPNPANRNFRVEILDFKSTDYSFELLGLHGEKISEIKNIRNSAFNVETGNLSNGFFLAILKNSEGIIDTEKICIQNN